jgi:hypothetical protein
METACHQDNGVNDAPNCCINVNKTLTKTKNSCVINDVIISTGSRKRNTFLIVMNLLLPRHPKFSDIFSQKKAWLWLCLAISCFQFASRFLTSMSDLVTFNVIGLEP